MPLAPLRCLLAPLAAALALALPALAEDAWRDWPVEAQDPDQGVTYAEEPGDEDSPRVMVLEGVPAPEGDAEEALQEALAAMWLEMNEVEGRAGSDGRLVIWGDVDAEQGERRFAAAIEEGGEGARVTAFYTLPEDFERMGGAALLGAEGSETAAAEPDAEPAAEAATAERAEDPAQAVATAEAPTADVGSAFPPGAIPAPDLVDAEGGAVVPGWTEVDGSWVGDPTNPELVRLYGVRFDPGEVETPLEAMVGAMEFRGLSGTEAEEPLPVPSYGEAVGTPLWLGLVTARSGGGDQVVAVEVTWSPEEERFNAKVVHAPPEIFAGWGGTGAILVGLGFVDAGVWDDEDLAGIGRMSLEEQRPFFAQAAETQWQGLMAQMMGNLMMQQQSTLNTMRQMNDNLSAETGCIVAGNCTMGYDGLGDAAPVYE